MTSTSTQTDKTYDIVLFGMTGFTGKLAAEYLLKKQYDIRWAACARNESKARTLLESLTTTKTMEVPILVADLICNSPEEENTLRNVVKSTRVVITTAGPFEKYALTLHKLCAEEGVHFADISGESSYFRRVIAEHDELARKTGATLVTHCGNDCIPHDVTVWEMHQYVKNLNSGDTNYKLLEVTTLDEFPSSAAMSGGTLTTAAFQLGKKKDSSSQPAFDPLLRLPDGTKSPHSTVVTHKNRHFHADPGFGGGRYAGPWLMAPVMANCVRRTNALLGYGDSFKFGDAKLDDPSIVNNLKETFWKLVYGVAIYGPKALQKYILPEPGDGPTRQTMEEGWMKLWGKGHYQKEGEENKEHIPVYTLFHFKKDIGYLMTAELLVETGMLLLERDASTLGGGVLTPAAAFGGELRKRITTQLEADFFISDTSLYNKSD